jgi:phosphotransferase system enzyme I (PtsI)
MQRLKGIAVTSGAAVGRAVLLVHRGQAVRFPIPLERVESEIARLTVARERSRSQLQAIKGRIGTGPGPELAALFDAQLLMLDDPMLLGRAEELIRTELVNAEWAMQRAFEAIERVFDAVEDPYLRERKGDVEDVVGRVRMNLRHGARARDLLRDIEGPFVLIADELAPSMAAQIDWTRVRGFAMDAGSRTYHTAILARSLQIPAIVGLHDATARVTAGMLVVIDGASGELIIDPTPDVVRQVQGHQPPAPMAGVMSGLIAGPAITQDGTRIRIDANIDLPDDLAMARQHGAQGVGLFRSEVLLGLESVESISEERQFEVYRRLIEGLAPQPVTIRTFDLEEHRSSVRRGALRVTTDPVRRRNPLGLRGIRLALTRPDVFKRQVRAMIRAAAHGTLRLLLPFISTVDDVRAAKRLIAEVQADLRGAGAAVAAVPVGAMIEVPSAALMADLLAREVDFLAIGTNDLIQYTLAVDRNDERLSELYQPLNPGLLRLIRAVRLAAVRAHRPVSVCGEMASDPTLLAVLIGLGLAEFSMTPRAIPAARHLVACVRQSELRTHARRLLQAGSVAELEAYLEGAVGEERHSPVR